MISRKLLFSAAVSASALIAATNAFAQSVSGSGTSPTQVGGAASSSGSPSPPAINTPASSTATVPNSTLQSGASLGEIVVTARRVNENLQTTPVSVTAITADLLSKIGAVNVGDISKITPNLTITTFGSNPSAAQLEIRGQVTNDNLITLDPAVGVYINDVYFARAYSDLTDLLDVSDVEVLKGPQGTLYGRNTIGGAIKVTTQQPNPSGDVNGFITLGGGNYSTFTSTAAISLPIVKDVLAVRLAASHLQHDGYTSSYLVNQPSLTPIDKIDSDNKDSTTLRATFVFTPIEPFKASLASTYFIDKSHGTLAVTQAGDVSDINGPGFTHIFDSPQRASDFYSGLTSLRPSASTVSLSDILTLEYHITPHLSTKAIFGYVDTKSSAQGNTSGVVTDSVALIEYTTNLIQTQHQFSGEYQLLGDAIDGRLNFLLGAYYFAEQGNEVTGPAGTVTIFGMPENADFDGSAHNESKSVYFNTGFKLTPRLTVNGGLRYTNDTKSIDAHTRIDDLCVYSPGGGITTSTTPGGPCSLSRVDNFYYLSFEGDASYRITNNIFTYAKVSDGYRSGGEQLRAVDSASSNAYQPDKVTSYEGGLKNEFFDRRLRLNLAYYHSSFTNVQQTEILAPGQLPDPTVPTTTTIVVNSGSAEADGFEIESAGKITPRLTATANIGYTNFRFDDPTIHAVYTPAFKESVSLSYDQPFEWGDVVPRLDFSHSDHDYAAPIKSEDSRLQAINLLDGRVTANLPHSLSLSAYAKNMLREEYYTFGIVTANTFGSFIGAPRTYGVEANYKF